MSTFTLKGTPGTTGSQGATWQSPLGIVTVAPAAGNFTTSTVGEVTITTAGPAIVHKGELKK